MYRLFRLVSTVFELALDVSSFSLGWNLFSRWLFVWFWSRFIFALCLFISTQLTTGLRSLRLNVISSIFEFRIFVLLFLSPLAPNILAFIDFYHVLRDSWAFDFFNWSSLISFSFCQMFFFHSVLSLFFANFFWSDSWLWHCRLTFFHSFR